MLDLKIETAQQGFHSGDAGGIVPDTFRILRILLDRVEDAETGRVCKEFHSDLPEWKLEEAKQVAQSQGEELYTKLPLQDGCRWVE